MWDQESLLNFYLSLLMNSGGLIVIQRSTAVFLLNSVFPFICLDSLSGLPSETLLALWNFLMMDNIYFVCPVLYFEFLLPFLITFR